jgi:hypothetical protein
MNPAMGQLNYGRSVIQRRCLVTGHGDQPTILWIPQVRDRAKKEGD